MYHSLTIDDINTWDDWHLIPTSRPTVNMPEVETKLVTIPGVHGFVDISNTLTGTPTYQTRSGTWEFYVHNEYEFWADIYSKIAEYLHGLSHRIILEDDPDYYYTGRLSIGDYKSDANWSTVPINYSLEPFKRELIDSTEPWKWDTFNFVHGVIRNFGEVSVRGSETLIIPTGAEPSVVQAGVLSEDSMTFELNSPEETTVVLGNTGDNLVEIGRLKQGENRLTITGTGVVKVLFRGGWL